MSRMLEPREVAQYAEEVIEVICNGCPEERGWGYYSDEEPHGEACKVMSSYGFYGEHEDVRIDDDGRVFCVRREAIEGKDKKDEGNQGTDNAD